MSCWTFKKKAGVSFTFSWARSKKTKKKKTIWHFLCEPIENVILTATKMCRVFPLNRKKWRKASFSANTRILPCDYASFSNCYTPKSIFLLKGTCSQSSAIQMENTRWELEWKSLRFSAGSQCKFCQCCAQCCSCMMQETGWEICEWSFWCWQDVDFLSSLHMRKSRVSASKFPFIQKLPLCNKW